MLEIVVTVVRKFDAQHLGLCSDSRLMKLVSGTQWHYFSLYNFTR